MKRLTADELNEIIKMYTDGINPKEIGEKFGIFNNSVTRILRKKGIIRNKLIRVSQDNINYIIKTYSEGISSTKIATELDIDGGTVCRILKRNGVSLRPAEENKRKFDIKSDFFETINSEEKAYFLGLLYADGNLSKRGYGITISLQYQDVGILNKLSNIIYGFEKIRIDSVDSLQNDGTILKRQYAVFNIYSKKMHKDLQNQGCPPDKAFIIKFPEINDDLVRHFIRGIVDGDGCICVANKSRPVIDITSNLEFLEGLEKWCTDKLNISFNKIQRRHKDRDNSTRNLQLTSFNQIKKFLDLIYVDSTVYLERKFEKYKEFNSILDEKEKNKNLKCSNIEFYNTTYVPSYNGQLVNSEYLETISVDEKEKIADELTIFYKNNGFPYISLSDDELIKQFSHIKQIKLDKVCKDQIINLNNGLGNNVFKHFSPHFYEIKSGTRKDKPSMVEAFKDDVLLKKVLMNRLSQNFTINGNMLKQGLANSNVAFKGSIFNISVAKFIYSKFTKEGSVIYDYSMGFGQRLLAALSLPYNVKYIGVDPCEKTVESNENIFNFYSENIPELDKDADIICSGSENYFNINYENKVDLAFSSPPYFNLELYDDNTSQANSSTYKYFINTYWENTVKNAVKMLKDGGHFILNIKDVVDGFLLSEDMLNICKKHGLKLIDTYKMQLTKNIAFKNKDGVHKYEPIYVLQK